MKSANHMVIDRLRAVIEKKAVSKCLPAAVSGSIISSTVLKPPADNATADNKLCGSSDCPWNNVTTKAARPDQTTVIIVGLAISDV